MRIGVWELVVFLAGATGAQAQPADPLIGQKIYPKHNRVQIRVGDKIVGNVDDLIYPIRVRKANADWLWIPTRYAEGWIARQDVVPLGESVAYFSSAVAQNPGDKFALQLRAMALHDLNRLDESLRDFTELVRIAPDHDVYNGRATIWLDKKEWDIAIRDLDEAIRMKPQYALGYHNRGLA